MAKGNFFSRVFEFFILTFTFFNLKLNQLISYIERIDPNQNNTRQRVIASLVLLPIAVIAIFYSQTLFVFIAIAAAMIMMMEWLDITNSAENRKKWRLLGFFYIFIPTCAIVKLRLMDSSVLFWMFSIIWATDIFAFFAGKILKGPKLAPSISPNKTWSGLAGGILVSAVIGFMSGALVFDGSVKFFILTSVILSAIEQISDLLESKVKRIFGVKDSGALIPGHGGVLDRLDGIILTAPIALLIVTIFSQNFVIS